MPDPNSKFGKGGGRANTYGFTGEDYDQDVGLLYLRARYYMLEVSRFINKDLFAGLTGKPSSLNPYIYCQNNPLVFADPLGLYALSETARRTRNFGFIRSSATSLGAQRALEQREQYQLQQEKLKSERGGLSPEEAYRLAEALEVGAIGAGVMSVFCYGTAVVLALTGVGAPAAVALWTAGHVWGGIATGMETAAIGIRFFAPGGIKFSLW